MRKARFKETEIVRVLKEVEGGRQVKEVCREYETFPVLRHTAPMNTSLIRHP